MKFSLDDLSAVVAFEKDWDPALGTDTRAYRELLGFAAARILQGGAADHEVVEYLRQLIAKFWTDPAPRGSS